MITVLLISLPESYSPLIVSLNTHPDRTKFDFVVQRCINEEACQLSIASSKQEVQVRFPPSVQTANRRRTRRILRVTGVRRRDTTGTSARKNWRWRRQRTRHRRRAKQQQPSQSLQTPEIWSGDSGGMVICGHTCARGGMLEIGDGYELGVTTE